MPPRRLSIHPQHLPDVLILNGFTGYEAISRPFHFQLQCIAENKKKVPFETLLGQVVSISIELPNGSLKWITGICNKVAQGGRDQVFTSYLLDLVPEFWFLSRKTHSRIFQHMKVSDILRKVLKFAHTDKDVFYKGKPPERPREFCVQYRESDYAFASRLMEEEGYHYYFEHGKHDSHMVVSNSPKSSFPGLKPPGSLTYEPVHGGTRPDDRILSWEKSQELKSNTVTLWDHCFELPYKHLEAWQELSIIQPSVVAGNSKHWLYTASNLNLKLYDYPGGYAKRFDGINKSGGEQPSELHKIFEDNVRTADIRMEEEASASVLVSGSSSVRHLVSGHNFTLKDHFEGDGTWVLYEIEHVASEAANVRSGRGGFRYENHFTCFPADLPFRPPRVTPRPVIHGTQTAEVTGPPGEEIFTDEYGRIKVLFHWDREGTRDSDSSCWIRVAQPIAGRRWGGSFWPRMGQEVIVAFLEGDPDQPIVIGSVYNDDQKPPYLGNSFDAKHKNDNKLMGVKSNTTLGGAGFNEWRFDDTKGKEQVFIHAERNMDVRVKSNSMESVGGSKHVTVGGEKEDGTRYGDYNELVFQNVNQTILGDVGQEVRGQMAVEIGEEEGLGGLHLCVHGLRTTQIDDEDRIRVKSNRMEWVDGDQHLAVLGNRRETVGQVHELHAGEEIHLNGGQKGKVVIEAGTRLSLKVGGNFIDISPAGVAIGGTMVLINSGGAPASGTDLFSKYEELPKPEPPDGAMPADDAKSGYKSSLMIPMAPPEEGGG